METDLLIEIKNEQVNVVLTQANIETRLLSDVANGFSDGQWHTLTLSIEDGERFVCLKSLNLFFRGRKTVERILFSHMFLSTWIFYNMDAFVLYSNMVESDQQKITENVQ